MANDYQYIESTGVIVPNTSVVLGGVQDEYRAAFGQDLIVTPDTPQGVLASAETLARTAVINNNAALANQINPNVAGGIFLDAIMALFGIQRQAATKSTIAAVTISGVAGTTIPAGVQAQTSRGDIFESLSTVVIGGGGTVAVDFVSLEYGAVQCAANELTQVVTNVIGWENVNNTNAAVLGLEVQTDQSARAYRNNTLGWQGVALPIAITSALYNVEGVTSLAFRENTANTTQVIDGISLVAKSIWACVLGGSDTDVAAALLENKSGGCAFNGGTTINLVEPVSGQTYAVKFDRPTAIPVLIKVTTTNGNFADIKSAVLAYVAGNIEGLEGFVVGADVLPFDISGAIITQFPITQITKVEISLTSPISYSTNVLAIALNQIATTQDSYITVVSA